MANPIEEARQVGAPDPVLEIGLVNNMPDAALRTTEEQFGRLLRTASHNRRFHLRYFTLPEIKRSAPGQLYIDEFYEDLQQLWLKPVDGLIVTGAEPHTPNLEDEPYWRTLTQLIDWSAQCTISTVWSCLAAHAAVQHFDGIRRRTLPAKLSGVYDCIKHSDHEIAAEAAVRWRIPHSRYNDLLEDELVSRGYDILSRSAAAGVDLFVKRRGSFHLFFQGHPEYGADTLFREYRRDVARYLRAERSDYPEMPYKYFDDDFAMELYAFRQRCHLNRDLSTLTAFPVLPADRVLLDPPWHGTAERLYANWISYLIKQKRTALEYCYVNAIA